MEKTKKWSWKQWARENKEAHKSKPAFLDIRRKPKTKKGPK